MRMISRLAAVLAFAGSVSCGGGGGGGTGPTPPPSAITMHLTGANGGMYIPAVDTVAAGGTVTWIWDDSDHDVTSDGPQTFPSSAHKTTPFTYGPIIMPTAGTYNFHCTNHGTPGAGMHGTVVAQ